MVGEVFDGNNGGRARYCRARWDAENFGMMEECR
jgi:hypothetical protein